MDQLAYAAVASMLLQIVVGAYATTKDLGSDGGARVVNPSGVWLGIGSQIAGGVIFGSNYGNYKLQALSTSGAMAEISTFTFTGGLEIGVSAQSLYTVVFNAYSLADLDNLSGPILYANLDLVVIDEFLRFAIGNFASKAALQIASHYQSVSDILDADNFETIIKQIEGYYNIEGRPTLVLLPLASIGARLALAFGYTNVWVEQADGGVDFGS